MIAPQAGDAVTTQPQATRPGPGHRSRRRHVQERPDDCHDDPVFVLLQEGQVRIEVAKIAGEFPAGAELDPGASCRRQLADPTTLPAASASSPDYGLGIRRRRVPLRAFRRSQSTTRRCTGYQTCVDLDTRSSAVPGPARAEVRAAEVARIDTVMYDFPTWSRHQARLRAWEALPSAQLANLYYSTSASGPSTIRRQSSHRQYARGDKILYAGYFPMACSSSASSPTCRTSRSGPLCPSSCPRMPGTSQDRQ